MPRDFQINGESLVLVKFGEHIPPALSNIPGSVSNLSELGLASEGIRITPRFVHHDLRVDDFGPNIPAEVLHQLADCTVSMTLIHYDVNTLDLCLGESLGGLEVGGFPGPTGVFIGTMNAAGTPLGGFVPYLQSGYHYTSMSILSPQLNFPWHFPAAYLAGTPMDLPLGTHASMTKLTWRAIPYNIPRNGDSPDFDGEIVSSGAILWDHIPDPS